MTSHRAPWLLATGLAFALAGCQKDAPAPAVDASTPAAATSESTPADAAATAQAGAAAVDSSAAAGVLTVVPGAVSACPGTQPLIADVSWNVVDPTVPSVKVEVGRAGEARKLMVEAGDTGTIKTGPWVSPGVQFTLSSKDGRELAQYEVTSEPCTTPAN